MGKIPGQAGDDTIRGDRGLEEMVLRDGGEWLKRLPHFVRNDRCGGVGPEAYGLLVCKIPRSALRFAVE